MSRGSEGTWELPPWARTYRSTASWEETQAPPRLGAAGSKTARTRSQHEAMRAERDCRNRGGPSPRTLHSAPKSAAPATKGGVKGGSVALVGEREHSPIPEIPPDFRQGESLPVERQRALSALAPSPPESPTSLLPQPNARGALSDRRGSPGGGGGGSHRRLSWRDELPELPKRGLPVPPAVPSFQQGNLPSGRSSILRPKVHFCGPPLLFFPFVFDLGNFLGKRIERKREKRAKNRNGE